MRRYYQRSLGRTILGVFVAWMAVGTESTVQALDPQKAISQYRLDTWSERQGLPQGSVQAITQSRDGYLWVGTRDGLARFDGVSFDVYRAETHPGLDANDIRCLYEDADGFLWIGTFNAGVSQLAGGRFTRYGPAEGLPSRHILSIGADRDGTLYLATPEGLFKQSGNRFESLQRPQAPGSGIHTLVSDRGGGSLARRPRTALPGRSGPVDA